MKTIATHNGTFHADDVFAVATILLAYTEEEFQIIRTRDKEAIAKADFVVDVGGIHDSQTFRFDHHQEGGAGMHENGLPYASFGLVWKEYGAIICGGDFFAAKQIEDGLVGAMDANDNGVKVYEELYPVSPFDLSHYVKTWNSTWKEESEWGEKAEEKRLEIFLNLVDWAKALIVRDIKRYKDKNAAYDLVKKIYEDSKDKRIIILDRFYPWEDVLLAYPEPVYVIFPKSEDVNSDWMVKGVPKEKSSFENRKPFPKEWGGKMDQELAGVSGVSDAIFCHKGLFLAGAKSKDGALALAQLAIDNK